MILILFLVLAFCLYLLITAPRLSEQKRMKAYDHIMFAHRGYHNADLGIPENSMSAFRAALEHGYGIELDVHLTADEKLVVFHDNTLDRVCGQSGMVEALTYAELETCTLLGTHERMPLLEDVLHLVHGQVPLLIELKIPTHSYMICEKVYQSLQNYNGTYLIQSFNTFGLRWFKLHAPEVLRGQLSSRLTKDPLEEPWITRFMVEHLLTNFLGRPDFISYKLADLPHPAVWLLRTGFGCPVAVWTLRTRKALKEGVTRYDIQIFEKHGENY